MADRMLVMVPVHVDARHINGAVVELHVDHDGIVSAETRIPGPAA